MPVLRLVLLTALLLGLLGGTAQAAPIGALKQYKVPTADSQPRDITNGSDGNRWFTESSEFVPPTIGRITPSGAVTEFAAGLPVLHPHRHRPGSRGHPLLHLERPDPRAHHDVRRLPGSRAHAEQQRARRQHGRAREPDLDHGLQQRQPLALRHRLGPVHPVPGLEPHDVAVDAAGIVWFTAPLDSAIGRLDPQTGAVTLTPTEGFPRHIAVAADGAIWFTERFVPQAVGRLDPATNAITLFPLTDVGPEGIAASPDGSVWFTQTTRGNIARITNDGVISESKVVKGSEPFGITVDAEGDPWYTMMSANKIGEFQLR